MLGIAQIQYKMHRQMGKELDERVISMPGMKSPIDEKSTKVTDAAYSNLDDDKLKAKLDKLIAKDASFNLSEFIEGAEGAFEWVVKAFNDGDKATLKELLSKDIYQEFADAMVDRMSSAAKADTTLISIESTRVTDLSIKNNSVKVIVEFVSEQIHVVRNEEGEVISGEDAGITQVEDEWVFERSLKSNDPNWTIIDT